MFAARKSVNWNCPGETSVALPSTLQLVIRRAKLVVEITVKLAPGILVKANRNAPDDSIAGLVKMIGAGSIRGMLDVLGMPLTNTVARA
jgi:hypothetical protein